MLYNNRYAEARGWVRTSAAFAVKTGREQVARAEVPGRRACASERPCRATPIFRDHPEGGEFIRGCRELWDKGLYAELGAYRCQVFLDFWVVRDDSRADGHALPPSSTDAALPASMPR